MSTVYHILDKIPAMNAEDIQIEYEELAQSLVKSGRLRIDTDHHCNFARFTDPSFNISVIISKEEITDPALIPQTRQYLQTLYGNKLTGNDFENKLVLIFKDFKRQISKLQSVRPEVTIKLARIFVQATHHIVIR